MSDVYTVSRNEFPIYPRDVDSSGHFWNAFGNCETEISALWIIRLLQKSNNWGPFTVKEISNFYEEYRSDGFTFNNLIDGGFVIKQGGFLYVTNVFILRCYGSRPAREFESDRALAGGWIRE